jgi:hypothetical protein
LLLLLLVLALLLPLLLVPSRVPLLLLPPFSDAQDTHSLCRLWAV